MHLRLLQLLRCPDCQQGFSLSAPLEPPGSPEVRTGLLACPNQHQFPVVAGIPRIFPGALAAHRRDLQPLLQALATAVAPGGSQAADIRRTRESFSREWANHRLGDRTWYLDLEARVQGTFLDALRIPPCELRHKTVLDAGCGNGSQSVAYGQHVAEVIAIDLSSSVELGQALLQQWPGARQDRVHFIQADLRQAPLSPGSVDIIHAAGVLHHTPDTYASFKALLPLLRPGGTFYVWVYRYEPWVTPLLRLLRAVTTRIPVVLLDRLSRLLAVPFIGFTMALDALGLRAYPRIRRREAALALMDIFGPPYAHYHSPAEVTGWFQAHGFTQVWSCDHSRRGFAVCGRLADREPIQPQRA
ncbi:MAG TPA: class I SAM-dependent methyltransferase [Chloroflexota bacterium]|nr:class I SAM-dependent methyltransferase [Chloroflexota bacterium]